MTPRLGHRSPPVPPPALRLRIDPAACDGIGVCAHLAPALVELDRWGFPIIAGRDVATEEVRPARGAVRGCPRKALWLEDAEASARRST